MSTGKEVVAGYVLCPRATHTEPKLVKDYVAQRTGGICSECFAVEVGRDRIRRIELVRQGQRLVVPARAKPSKKRYRYRPERNRRKALNSKARERARKRVADMVPELYDAVLAEERAKLGLEPWPVEIAIRGTDPNATIESLARAAGIAL
jgi:hypothetical protein